MASWRVQRPVYRHALSFLPLNGGGAFVRNVHMLSAYWGFAIISLHLGFQWIVVVGMAKKLVARPSNFREYILRSVSLLIAGYGVYAFFKRDIGSYLILANQFAFFDFALPVVPVGRHSVYGDFYQRRTLQFNLVQKYEKGQREADQSRGNYECL